MLNNESLLDKAIRALKLPQSAEAYRWTQTAIYRKKLKRFWVIGGVSKLSFPRPAYIIFAEFYLTYLSFAFLEEGNEEQH